MAALNQRERILLGWREWVGLPELGLAAVRCKIDSGARSSALHVDALWRFSERGAPWVGFRLSNDGHGDATVEVSAPIFDERAVVDSGGHRTRRIFLRTPLRLAGIEREIEINLTDRQGMLFPMLLGRTAMVGCFAVDPGRSFLHGRRPAHGVWLSSRGQSSTDIARHLLNPQTRTSDETATLCRVEPAPRPLPRSDHDTNGASSVLQSRNPETRISSSGIQ